MSDGGSRNPSVLGEVLAPAVKVPSDDTSERAVLGGLILNNDAIASALEMGLAAESFHSYKNSLLFRSILGLHREGKPADLVTLKSRLVQDGQLEAVGGVDYPASLAEQVPGTNADSVRAYVAAVVETAKERREVAAALSFLRATSKERRNGAGVKLRQEIGEALTPGLARIGLPRTIAFVRAEHAALGERERISLGFQDVDPIIGGGVPPGSFVVIGGFSGVGKSWTLVLSAVHHALAGRPVLFVSLEMAGCEIAVRYDMVLDGRPAPDGQVWIWSESSSLEDIVRAITEWVAEHDGGGVPVVLIDYAQLVRPTPQPMRSREVEIVGNALRDLARKLGIVIIAGAQLGRRSLEAERPRLDHLREGALEQPVDLALLIWRPGEDSSRLSMSIAKSRFSAISDRDLSYSADWGRGKLEILGAAERLEPLALKVREYLAGCEGHRAKLKEISSSVKDPGTRKHPAVARLVEAAMSTRAYQVEDGYGFIPGGGA